MSSCLLILLAFVGCGSDQPLVANPGEAIVLQMQPPVSIAPGESLLMWVNTGNANADEFSFVWTARNSRSEDVTDTVFAAVDAPANGESDPASTEAEEAPVNRGPKARFSTNEAGTYLITVTITARDGKKATESVILEVVADNSPPRLDETNPITVDPAPPYRAGRDIFLTAQAADPEDDRLTYEWSIKDQDNQEVLDGLESTTGPTIKFTPQTAGSFLATVAVTDAREGRDRASILVIVSE
jgi:hypothetical protein